MASQYILYLFTLGFFAVLTQAEVEPLPKVILEDMGSREMRHHHFLWHNIRNLWLRMDPTTQEDLMKLGWDCPRPSQTYEDGVSYPIEDNDSGEDFLYMHRQMVVRAKSILANLTNATYSANSTNTTDLTNSTNSANYTNLTEPIEFTGFQNIPSPTSKKYPVPPAYEMSGSLYDQIVQMKSDDFYYNSIKPREDRFKDPKYLRTLTLGQFGSKLEFTVHNWLHLRFSGSCLAGYRNRGVSNPLPDIDVKYDVLEYDWLVDSYSSAANPYFWKIHLWVDDRIQDWMNANGVKELEWKGTWTGGSLSRLADLVDVGKHASIRNLEEVSPGFMAHDHMHGTTDENNSASQGETIDVMSEVTKILLRTGLESNIYDKVVVRND